MNRRWAISLALVFALSGGTLPASGDTGSEALRQFELVRTTSGPSSLQFVANLSPPDGIDMDAFVGAVAVRTAEDGTVLASEPVMASTIGHTNEPEVYRNGERVASVPCDGEVCIASRSAAATVWILTEDEGGSEPMNRYYVIFEGAEVHVDLQGNGWELQETAGLAYRYIDWRSSEGAGVAALGSGASAFSAAEADGGSLGSVAMAQPPCSASVVPAVGGGAGVVTLRGGQHESTAQCPSLGPATAGHASETVRWSVEGTAVGDHTLNEVRLFVVDLPPCNRRVAGVTGEVDGVTCE